MLNRLRELAQRQADVNERLKELKSALDAAKTPEARQELERQLKRLRDQQQQILRDTDEVRERMEQEENRERMANSREQIEQGREHVRQASEALEQGQLSQALTEGTRAGRQLNDLREDLRKSSANRFTEAATEMREQARRLSDEQQKLTEKLEASNQSTQHSLRDTGERKQVRDGFEQQQERLSQLMDQMRRTVEDAEESEPLLAKELYDTVRKADEQRIPDALKVSQQLVDLGVSEDAARVSRQAGQGLDKLREGVERAVKSVLGDETGALKRAQNELEDLGGQVDREIADATGTQPPSRNETAAESGPGQRRNAQEGSNLRQQADRDSSRVNRGEQGEQERNSDQAHRGRGTGGPLSSRPGIVEAKVSEMPTGSSRSNSLAVIVRTDRVSKAIKMSSRTETASKQLAASSRASRPANSEAKKIKRVNRAGREDELTDGDSKARGSFAAAIPGRSSSANLGGWLD